jgi:hypothetical protein
MRRYDVLERKPQCRGSASIPAMPAAVERGCVAVMDAKLKVRGNELQQALYSAKERILKMT